jgi:hypothetical protein
MLESSDITGDQCRAMAEKMRVHGQRAQHFALRAYDREIAKLRLPNR